MVELIKPVHRTATATVRIWFLLLFAVGLHDPGCETWHHRFLRMAGADDRHAFWPDELRKKVSD